MHLTPVKYYKVLIVPNLTEIMNNQSKTPYLVKFQLLTISLQESNAYPCNVDYYHTFIPLLQSNGIMKMILFVASLILLLPLFACLQSHVKSVEHLQSDYDRLHSLQISLERDLLHAPDPLKVENDLREVELRMRYIEIEILKRQYREN